MQASNVVREYVMGAERVRAVDGVSLEITGGDFVALLGPSGSGKSTLLNLIAGLDSPTAGSISVNGRNLAAMSSRELACYRRQTVGIVFQSFYLIPSMTLAQNVELPMRFAEVPREERGQRVEEALATVKLSGRAAHRPAELSGGEQQRAAIARAVVMRPKLLLADEPTGNLDSRTGQGILELLSELNSGLGTTVLMVTHEQALAESYARRLLHMADGRIVSAEEAAR